jgi:transaldolase
MILGTPVARKGRFSGLVQPARAGALVSIALLGCMLLLSSPGGRELAASESAITMGAMMPPKSKISMRSPALRFASTPRHRFGPVIKATQVAGNPVKEAQLDKIANDPGFISALDESGGSSPKTLKAYGYTDKDYKDTDEMLSMVHDLRAKIMTNPEYKEGKIIGSILFEDTIDREVDGLPTCEYLWGKKNVVPFLKTDVGLAPAADGVQLMKENPGLEDMLDRGLAKGCWGTKQRSLILSANPEGIRKLVAQQFEFGKRTIAKGMVPILEPEVDITAKDKAEIEDLLLAELIKGLETLGPDDKVMFKLSLPENPNQYQPLMKDSHVVRVVALSGGYDLAESTKRLAQNDGMIASFSRTLREGLHKSQTDEEFTKTLGATLDKVTAASATGHQCKKTAPVHVLADATEAEMTQLDRLKTMTSVVADTGDFDAIKAACPEDCTTNPSLLLAAAKMEKFQPLLQEAASESRKNDGALAGEDLITDVCDRFAVKVGVKLLELLPAHGRVSTEVDADLSFDTEASLAKAKKILALYEAENVPKERILIKLGTTWESIQTCRQLEKEGITCNMTLLFSIVQAIACAEAGATLISPFVGRIMDWYKKSTGKKEYTADEDPGVQSVRRIYRYYKKYGYDTIVMGASFRNTGEIVGLAGCDKLTIAPKLLDELAASSEPFEQVLHKDRVECNDPKVSYDEKSFRWAMNEDPMATEQLATGLRNFAKDGQTLRDYVKQEVLTQ